jgi:hypothetical protein
MMSFALLKKWIALFTFQLVLGGSAKPVEKKEPKFKVPPQTQKLNDSITPLFQEEFEEVHWTDASNREGYGSDLDHAWCDTENRDIPFHQRDFSDRHFDGQFFPEGQKKWRIGRHWQDLMFSKYDFALLSIEKAPVYFHDLNDPWCGAIRKSFQMKTLEIENTTKIVIRDLLAKAALTVVIIGVLFGLAFVLKPVQEVTQVQYLQLSQQLQNQIQVVEKNIQVISNSQIATQALLEQNIKNNQEKTQTLLSVLEVQQQVHEKEMIELRQQINRMKKRRIP